MLQIPSSFLDVRTAELVMGRGLPREAGGFALAFGIMFAIATAVKIKFADRWWHNIIPGGVPFAIGESPSELLPVSLEAGLYGSTIYTNVLGIYNVPSFTIARALGGISYWAYSRRSQKKSEWIITLASGLILGESLASLCNLAFAGLNVPTLGPPRQ